MTRPLMLILVGLMLTGCRTSQSPANDPFFPRTTIPPPPTGAATGRAEPYYQAPPVTQTTPQMPAAATPPMVQMPAPTPAAASPPLVQQMPGPAPLTVSPPAVQIPQQAPAGLSRLQPSPGPQLPPSQPPAAAAPTVVQPVSPPGLVPNLSAPRPTSTAPGSFQPSRPASVAPPAGAASPYAPSGSTLNYRGASGPSSTPLVPTQPDTRASLPSSASLAASPGHTIAVSEDRSPKPIDDSPANSSATLPGPKPTVQTVQQRPKDSSPDRPIDIMDLPPAGSAGGEAKPLRPAGP